MKTSRLGLLLASTLLLQSTSTPDAHAQGFPGGSGGGGGVGGSGAGNAGVGGRLGNGSVPPGFSGSGSGSGSQSGGGGSMTAMGFSSSRKAFHFQLARDPEVQSDLGLRPDQKTAIASAGQRLDASLARLNDTIGRTLGSGNVNPTSHRNLQTAQERSSKECEAIADSALRTLTPAQLARLEQIRLQNPMVVALPDEALTKALGITPDQIARARRILMDSQKDMNEAIRQGTVVIESTSHEERSPDGTSVSRSSSSRSGPSPDPAVRAASERAIRAASERRDSRLEREVLTTDQKAKLATLRGKPLQRSGTIAQFR